MSSLSRNKYRVFCNKEDLDGSTSGQKAGKGQRKGWKRPKEMLEKAIVLKWRLFQITTVATSG